MMRTIAVAGAGCAALLAGTAVTTTTHASGGLLGRLGHSQSTQSSRVHRLVEMGGVLPLSMGNAAACANALHAGGINLIGEGKSNGVGCTNTRYGAGYGTNLVTLAPLPASPLIGSCQVM